MGSFWKISLVVLMFAVGADSTTAWICMHVATACHLHDHEDQTHSHTHDHGPFEHSHDSSPAHVQHAVKLVGVVGPSFDTAATLATQQPAQAAADVDREVAHSTFPSRVITGLRYGSSAALGPAGRSVLLKTERWLA